MQGGFASVASCAIHHDALLSDAFHGSVLAGAFAAQGLFLLTMGNSSCCAEEPTAPGGNACFARPDAKAFTDLGVPTLLTQPPHAPEERRKEAAAPSLGPNAESNAASAEDPKAAERPPRAPDTRFRRCFSVSEEAPSLVEHQHRSPSSFPLGLEPPSSLLAGKFPGCEATLWPDSESDASVTLIEERGFAGLGIFVIGNFHDGPAAVWNAAQKSDSTRLFPGDRVVNVNGAVCSRAVLLAAAKSNRPYTITVARWPEEFSVQLNRKTADDKFGITLELIERSNGMQMVRVGEIRKGLLEDWNNEAKAHGRLHEIVTLGAILLEVSGEKGDHFAMMSKLQGDEVVLRVKRPDVAAIERFARQQPQVAG